MSGKGTVYSYGEVHHAIQPVFREFSPYLLLLVELDEAREAKSESDRGRRLSDLLAAYRRDNDNAHRQQRHAALRDGRLDNHQEEEALGEIFANLKNRQTGPLSTDG